MFARGLPGDYGIEALRNRHTKTLILPYGQKENIMKAFMLGAVAMGLGLVVAASAPAAGGGHGGGGKGGGHPGMHGTKNSFNPGKKGSTEANVSAGKKGQGGNKFKNKSPQARSTRHYHCPRWASHGCWSDSYCCYCYWCPDDGSWYYYCEPQECYCPLSSYDDNPPE
jgi:hypothetical protein